MGLWSRGSELYHNIYIKRPLLTDISDFRFACIHEHMKGPGFNSPRVQYFLSIILICSYIYLSQYKVEAFRLLGREQAMSEM